MTKMKNKATGVLFIRKVQQLTIKLISFVFFFDRIKNQSIMTKNPGGKGHRKSKHHGGTFRREILFKDYGQEYAQITKMLGNGHCECQCYDDVIRLGNIRGKMRKRVWISVGDVVLCGLREYQDDKVDIIHKYTAEEVHNLKAMGEIPFDKADQENDDSMAAEEEVEEVNFEMI